MTRPHEFGQVDDCTRCIHCETLPGKTEDCTAAPKPRAVWVPCWKCALAKVDACAGECIDGWLVRSA